MRCVYTFRLRTPVRVTPPVSFSHDGLDLSFVVEGSSLVAFQITVSVPSDGPLPSLEAPSGDKPAHFRLEYPHFSKVVATARAFLGLLAFGAPVEVNTEAPDVEWLPSSDEERARLGVYSVRHDTSPPAFPTIDRRALVRCFAAAPAALPYEVALTFFRRGSCALNRGDTVQSFYDFFFVLEHLFGSGKSNPDRLLEAFLSSELLVAEVSRHLADNKSLLAPARGNWATSPTGVLRRLIDVRGRLHHHSWKNPRAWHPDDASRHLDYARLLGDLTVGILAHLVEPAMFSAEANSFTDSTVPRQTPPNRA